MIILVEKPKFDTALIYSDNVLFLSGLKGRIKREVKPQKEIIISIQNGDFDMSPENFYVSLQTAYNGGIHGHHLARRIGGGKNAAKPRLLGTCDSERHGVERASVLARRERKTPSASISRSER
jgi:hypothetical protein